MHILSIGIINQAQRYQFIPHTQFQRKINSTNPEKESVSDSLWILFINKRENSEHQYSNILSYILFENL